MADRLAVSGDYPDSWRRLADLPLFASEPWAKAMAGRLEGRPVWLSTGDSQNGPTVGMAGYVVSRPDSYRYGNAAAIAADPDSPFAPPAVRTALASTAVDPAQLFPHLLLSYPGYSTFPVGCRRSDGDSLRGALCAVAEWAAGEGLAAVALPYTPAGSALAAAAADTGHRHWLLGTDTVLDIPAAGFEGYLAVLSRHRRHRVRADRRAVERRGLRGTCRGHDLDDRVLQRMAELRAQHRARYGLPADQPAERARLARVIGLLGARTTVFTVDDPADGSVVCFSCFVRDGEVWHALYVAADYTDPRHRETYFEAAFYLPIEAAAERGVRRISYGFGSESAKRLRGCQDEPLRFFIKAVSPAAGGVVTALEQAWRAGEP